MQSSRHHQLLPVLLPSCGGLDAARAHKRARTCADEVVAFSLLDVEEPFLPGVPPFPTPHYNNHNNNNHYNRYNHYSYTEHGDGGGCCLPQPEDHVDLDQEWNEILQQLTDLSPLLPPWLQPSATATATTATVPSSPTSTTATTSPSASAGSPWNTATTTTSLPSTPITTAASTTTTTAGGSSIEIDLCHKPRGSGGVWFPLEQDQPLRVTKGMGKRLRVAVHSRRPFAWEELTLTLVDLTTGRTCPEMLSFPHKSTLKEEPDGSTRAEVEVKIERLCSRLYIRVAIAAAPSGGGGGGWTWEGRSGSFLTHNNGNIGRKRKIPPAKGEAQQQQQQRRPGHADEEEEADSNNRRA
ncbi:uncharacterized protein ACA1_060460 [Acanthamoeba castellanii str. Neff]|uniref:Uncharacterized protein n=1 Tax=Acanthamoeba castellanii (strain ATCC 30010 / Neff) TaxID=1257118 RepID=L8GVQ0_ACACF|nr:uncharacterized protein ACA1_060460 [Acanthamoeba castellanii str. Neff]ELR17319.1 hypothetical protein ACA1_060460 [Acanthamoeba castellanii str. Neff]